MCYQSAHPTVPWCEAPLAPPLGELLSEREAEGVHYETRKRCKTTHDTLSVSPFGLPALPEGEPRALRAYGSPNWRPLRTQRFLHDSIQQTAQLRLLREANSLPYNGGAYTSAAIFIYFPVDPKPPSPRWVAERLSVSTYSGMRMGVTTSWAMRSPEATVWDSVPWLCRATINSPR